MQSRQCISGTHLVQTKILSLQINSHSNTIFPVGHSRDTILTSYIVKTFDTFKYESFFIPCDVRQERIKKGITMGIGPMQGIISGPFISSLVFETWNNVTPSSNFSSQVQLLSLNGIHVL